MPPGHESLLAGTLLLEPPDALLVLECRLAKLNVDATLELEASRKELELSRSQAAGSDARSLQHAAELADAQQRAAAAESELIAVS